MYEGSWTSRHVPDPYVERVVALGFGEPVGGEEVLARRRHAEIDEDVLERRPARATAKRNPAPCGRRRDVAHGTIGVGQLMVPPGSGAWT